MIKNQTFVKIFIGLRVVLDALLVPLVVVGAYSLKFKVGTFLLLFFDSPMVKIYHHAQVEPYLQNAWILIVLWLVTFYYSGVYRQYRGIMPGVDEFIQVVKGVSLVTIELALVTFMFKIIPASRYVLIYTWLVGILMMSGSRFVLQWIERRMRKKGIGSNKSLVMGSDAFGQDIAEKMIVFPAMGYHYFGNIDEQAPEQLHFHLQSCYKRLGGWEEYPKVISENHITHVFVTDMYPKTFNVEKLIAYCTRHKIKLFMLSGDHSYLSHLGTLFEFDGLNFIQFFYQKPPVLSRIGKRLLDIGFSLLFLILLSPIFLLVSILIFLVSPGPVLYVQERLTKDDKPFGMIKFRTMHLNAESKSGPVMVNERGDSRYHYLGEFLRKNSIDEWPQLFNVLIGQMSIVGPRPERPFFVEEFEKTIPNFRLRHYVKGGITGWAQINGRSVLTRRPDHKLKYDLYYIKNWSILLDIKIIIKTFLIVLKREEAY